MNGAVFSGSGCVSGTVLPCITDEYRSGLEWAGDVVNGAPAGERVWSTVRFAVAA